MAKDEMKWEAVSPEATGDTITWDFEENPEFVGKFLRKEENVGKNKSTIYKFKDSKDNEVSVWSTAVLDTKLGNFAGGEMVKIVYKGKTEGKNGRSYKDFDVFVGK